MLLNADQIYGALQSHLWLSVQEKYQKVDGAVNSPVAFCHWDIKYNRHD